MIRGMSLRPILLCLGLAAATAIASPSADAKPDTAAAAQKRVDAAASAFAVVRTRWTAGAATVDTVCEWSVRWLVALRDQPVRGKALAAALADHLTRMQDLDRTVADMVKAGSASSADAAVVAYFVAEAELWVARGK